MKTWIQKHVLLVAAGYLLAYVLGRTQAYLMVGRELDGDTFFLRGAAYLSTLICLKMCFVAYVHNLKAHGIAREGFPEDLEKLKESGIESEIDFAYAMDQLLSYPSMHYLDNAKISPAPLLSRKLYRKGETLFEEMFGRKPEGAGCNDWKKIAILEMARKLGRNTKEVSLEQVKAHIPEKVREYYRKLQERRTEESKVTLSDLL